MVPSGKRVTFAQLVDQQVYAMDCGSNPSPNPKKRPRGAMPARTLAELRGAESLSVHNLSLYWASSCIPYLHKLEPTPVHKEHIHTMIDVLDTHWPSIQFFFENLPVPSDAARPARRRITFWLRYAFLVMSIADYDDYDLLFPSTPPLSFAGSERHWFFEHELKSCPLPCSRSRCNTFRLFASQAKK